MARLQAITWSSVDQDPLRHIGYKLKNIIDYMYANAPARTC